MPEASPASSLGTSAMAIWRSGINDAPAPSPRRRNAKKTWGK